ncbi:MAG: DoxX family protein [Bacteroidota bacterium]|nr:DoxX family protein [Bacteroidota bacterium]
MKYDKRITVWIFTVLRILIGWHFLYEGIVKLFNPGWSSASFLMESKWLLSGFFHWLIGNPTTLSIVDFLNTWGLLIIGLCLFLGLITRIASISGALLLILYYIASPPFVYSSLPSTSHFYIINYNLIEAVILAGLTSLPGDYLWSIQRLILFYQSKRKEERFPASDNQQKPAMYGTTRRELIKNLAVIPVFGTLFFGMLKKRGWISFEEKNLASKVDAISSASLITAKTIDIKELKGKVPTGKIKDVVISRIIIGGNLISGFAHARDLIYVSSWLKTYFTDEKVIETLWLCEACGINTAILRTDENTIRILSKYWKRGGKIQWLAQTYPKGQDVSNIKWAIDSGAIGAFVMGNVADQIIRDNKIEDMVTPVEYIKSQGLISGVAGHSMSVPEACVANGINVDFFMKTFHHTNYWSSTPVDPADPYLPEQSEEHSKSHDNLWCMGDKAVADFFRNNTTPWIAYKILAAGAIKPEDGIRYAFSSGADFACIGMFDFQVIENSNIACDILNTTLGRERKWYA